MLLAFLELKQSHLHIVSILNIGEKTLQYFHASLFVTICFCHWFFLTIGIKRGVFYWVFLAGLPFFPGPARELCSNQSNQFIDQFINNAVISLLCLLEHIVFQLHLLGTGEVSASCSCLAKMNPRENPVGGGGNVEIDMCCS